MYEQGYFWLACVCMWMVRWYLELMVLLQREQVNRSPSWSRWWFASDSALKKRRSHFSHLVLTCRFVSGTGGKFFLPTDESAVSNLQCCGSGVFIPDPVFLSVPDLGSENSNKRERWKKISCTAFFCSQKYNENWKLFYFWTGEENNLGQFTKNYRTFYPKNCH